MDNETLRNVVARLFEERGHGNPDFMRQIREGVLDSGILMQVAHAVNNDWLARVRPAPEVLED